MICLFRSYLSCTVEHFQDPVKGISEMGRVLEKKGILSISVDSLCLQNSNERFMKWQKKHFVTRYFTKSEWNEILNKINLKLDEEKLSF